jgi:hypothetical protein
MAGEQKSVRVNARGLETAVRRVETAARRVSAAMTFGRIAGGIEPGRAG